MQGVFGAQEWLKKRKAGSLVVRVEKWELHGAVGIVGGGGEAERYRIGHRMAEVRVRNYAFILLAGYSKSFLSRPVSQGSPSLPVSAPGCFRQDAQVEL